MEGGVFILIVFIGSLFAGFIGSLTGLGGGIIIIPLLTLLLGVHINYAIGAGLISVIATSSGSAINFLKKGITNVRIGMFLEVATAAGAICGALLAGVFTSGAISVIFGALLIFTVVMSTRKKSSAVIVPNPNSKAAHWRLESTYIENDKTVVAYSVKNIFGGFVMMLVAGVLSGLLGIGSGVLKVIAMDNIMKMPFKVSTTTSSFMIGVTAIASAVIYLQKGYIISTIAAPVMLGVLIGAMIGARVLPVINTSLLKKVFFTIVSIVAIQMIYKGIVN